MAKSCRSLIQKPGFRITYSLHCSSFLGLPFGILNIKMVKPKKGTTMETLGRTLQLFEIRIQNPNNKDPGFPKPAPALCKVRTIEETPGRYLSPKPRTLHSLKGISGTAPL